ncbi:delta-1-pyrroline-5-carboxylate synthase-like isoform X2 [Uloborus diversus]|uniref:delta-1-pyrroline-5-carboxylate synthase-like isoform X2 n=1 Tax=Uloborus diversus TaxID=327109 RepID=UPI002409E082|nr:delta-1-pyrroline-5-carboxylate synthase-like isoform X2 [Uloborus diversus]
MLRTTLLSKHGQKFERICKSTRHLNSNRRCLSSLHKDLDGKESRKGAFNYRSQLKNAKRVVVKLGSAVVTRADQSGLALGRLASIVEQVSHIQNEGKECLVVSSGAVAFGKQKLKAEMKMSMSMRETLSPLESGFKAVGLNREPRAAAAAIGQSGIVALFDVMFSQYGVSIAQVLVTKPDFYNPESRYNLKNTVLELLGLNIIPIVNTNDTVVPPDHDYAAEGAKYNQTGAVMNIKDNDSLAAHLAVEVDADLLILMSDVDGIYTSPPGDDGSRLLHSYCPPLDGNVIYGVKSGVGLGGMESKVQAASWALERGVAVVICNGTADQAISRIFEGKKIGTFFTDHKSSTEPVENLAVKARRGGRRLQELSSYQRAEIILTIADFLENREDQILEANSKDIQLAEETGLSTPLLSRLSLNHAKLNSLADGLRQIAESSHKVLGRLLRRTQIAEGMELQQITVPIGVLLVIFESRPDCLPQVTALAIASGNGLLLKGGKEANHTNAYLMKLVEDALAQHDAKDAISLVNSREDVGELLQMENYIDLVIPRGSSELVKNIQQQSHGIPVLGHSEGVCHVYIDEHADKDMAKKINEAAKKFLQSVDSACVFHNCSSRMSDGYRFGLGAEVGISTTRIHARGPVGVEGLLTTKWVLYGSGNTVADFNAGKMKYIHESLPLES